LATGNSQDGRSDSAVGGLGPGFELGFACACARFESALMARKRARISELCVLIKIPPKALPRFVVDSTPWIFTIADTSY
jgi:hypothetical protein